jgi:3-phosphoshikimate 1-carboxyvinyltransferase
MNLESQVVAKDLLVKSSVFFGDIISPPSKSHTMRAILAASFAKGESEILNILPSNDTNLLLAACKSFGATIKQVGDNLIIKGVNGALAFKNNKIYVGNSGIIYRFITAVAALDTKWIEIDGDSSIRHNRLIKPLLDSLVAMGAVVDFLEKENCAPFKIKGPIKINSAIIDCIESQPVSALMWLSLVKPCDFCITVKNCQEWSWLEFTQKWLQARNVDVVIRDNKIHVRSQATVSAFNFVIPGDFSTALFPIVASVITAGRLKLHGLIKDDWQGDKVVIDHLLRLGVDIKWQDNCLLVNGIDQFQGGVIDLQYCIDSLPILVILAIFAKQKTTLLNCKGARFKESDRLSIMAAILNDLGVRYKILGDHFEITPGPIIEKNIFKAHNDHRIALSLLVLGMKFKSLIIKDFNCAEKTYPNIIQSWQKCNTDIQIIDE